MDVDSDNPPQEHELVSNMRSLAGAMQAKGVLPVLKTFRFLGLVFAGEITPFAQALASGAVPSLSRLYIDPGLAKEADVELLLGMLEARARRVDCKSIKALAWDWEAGGEHFYMNALNTRLLLAALPSAEELPTMIWCAAYEEAFLEIRPPNMKKMVLAVGELGPAPSAEVLEMMPSLVRLACTSFFTEAHAQSAPMIQSILSAFSRGVAFQCLRELRLEGLYLTGADSVTLIEALARAAFAPQLEVLEIERCNNGHQGIERLATLLGQDIFPALKHLSIAENQHVADAVVTLTNWLLSAPRTRLVSLNLSCVEMGLVGMNAVEAVILGGAFSELEDFDLSYNTSLSDQAVLVLAGAVHRAAIGLPHLRKLNLNALYEVTGNALGILVFTAIHKCPRLEMVQMVPARKKQRRDRESLHALLCTLDWRGEFVVSDSDN